MSTTGTQTFTKFSLDIPPLRLSCSPLPHHAGAGEVVETLKRDSTFLAALGTQVGVKVDEVELEVTRRGEAVWAGEVWAASGTIPRRRFVVTAVPSDIQNHALSLDDVAKQDYSTLSSQQLSRDAELGSVKQVLSDLRINHDELQQNHDELQQSHDNLQQRVAELEQKDALALEMEVMKLTTRAAAIMAIEAAISYKAKLDRSCAKLTLQEKRKIDRSWGYIEDVNGWQETGKTLSELDVASFEDVGDDNEFFNAADNEFFNELPAGTAAKVRASIAILQAGDSETGDVFFNILKDIENDEEITKKRRAGNRWAHGKPVVEEVQQSLQRYRPGVTVSEIRKTLSPTNFA